MQQDYDNGKYTVILDELTGAMRALRHGEEWQDMSGNKLVYWMLVEHKHALERIAELEKDAARLVYHVEHAQMWLNSEADAVRVSYAKSHLDTAMQKD